MRWLLINVTGWAWLCCCDQLAAAPRPFELTDDPDVPGSVVTLYNPADGMVTVRGNNVTLTAYQLESDAGLFEPNEIHPDFVFSPFDITTNFKMFTLRTDGVQTLTLGRVLESNLAPDQLLNDLIVDFTFFPAGGCLGCPGCPSCPITPSLYIVPEPSSAVLLLIGAVMVHAIDERRRAGARGSDRGLLPKSSAPTNTTVCSIGYADEN